jgi:hypothetical protein
MRLLTSTQQVIEALGGIRAVADLMKVSSAAVYNWRSVGKFPANRMFEFQRVLEPKFKPAPDLWQMKG